MAGQKATFDTSSDVKNAKGLIKFNPLAAMPDGKRKAIFTGEKPNLRTGMSRSTPSRPYSILEAKFSVEGDVVTVAIDKPAKLVEGDEYEIRKVTNGQGFANAWLS